MAARKWSMWAGGLQGMGSRRKWLARHPEVASHVGNPQDLQRGSEGRRASRFPNKAKRLFARTVHGRDADRHLGSCADLGSWISIIGPSAGAWLAWSELVLCPDEPRRAPAPWPTDALTMCALNRPRKHGTGLGWAGRLHLAGTSRITGQAGVSPAITIGLSPTSSIVSEGQGKCRKVSTEGGTSKDRIHVEEVA